jgi:predicted porin
MGKVKFMAMVGNNSDGLNTGNNYVVGVDYSLSAKTALYLKTGSVDNNMTASGNKVTGTAAGLRIVF